MLLSDYSAERAEKKQQQRTDWHESMGANVKGDKTFQRRDRERKN